MSLRSRWRRRRARRNIPAYGYSVLVGGGIEHDRARHRLWQRGWKLEAGPVMLYAFTEIAEPVVVLYDDRDRVIARESVDCSLGRNDRLRADWIVTVNPTAPSWLPTRD